MTKKKRFIFGAIAVIGLCAAVAVAYFFTDSRASANARTGVVQVALNEDFPASDSQGAPLDSVKTFFATNTGEVALYVRARIFSSPEYCYAGTDGSGAPLNEWRPLAVPSRAFMHTVNSPDWIEGGDGFLYYRQPLAAGASSEEATVTVAITDPGQLPTGADIRLNVRVELEAAQAANEAYKILFDVGSLPPGVQTLVQEK